MGSIPSYPDTLPLKKTFDNFTLDTLKPNVLGQLNES